MNFSRAQKKIKYPKIFIHFLYYFFGDEQMNSSNKLILGKKKRKMIFYMIGEKTRRIKRGKNFINYYTNICTTLRKKNYV